MSFVCLLVLAAFSVYASAKCDKYVVGTVWIHKPAGDDEAEGFQGCKKGCFWNNTYTEDGVRKCEQCSDIEDEINCTNNDATCQWKNGKCKSQSCPNIAKTKNTGAYILDNTRGAASKGRARQLKECLEGSALEQKYNNQYWDDYRAHHNYKYYYYNIPDICVGPGSCQLNPGNNGTQNNEACIAQSGCSYVSAAICTPVIADCHRSDQCQHIDDRCPITSTGIPNNDKTTCETKTECKYDEHNNCVAAYRTFQATSNATTNNQSCVNLKGVYIPFGSYPEQPLNDGCLLQCIISGTTPFVAGTNTKKQCTDRQCSYFGLDTDPDEYPGGDSRGVEGAYPGDGINLKKGGVFDLCELGDKTGKNLTKCRMGENSSLAINFVRNRCDDRLYTESSQSSERVEYCNLGPGYATPESCGNCEDAQYTTESECISSFYCDRNSDIIQGECGSCDRGSYTTSSDCESAGYCSGGGGQSSNDCGICQDTRYLTKSECDNSGDCGNEDLTKDACGICTDSAYLTRSDCESAGSCNFGSYSHDECGYCQDSRFSSSGECENNGSYWNSYWSTTWTSSWNGNYWNSYWVGNIWTSGSWEQNIWTPGEWVVTNIQNTPKDCRTLFSTKKQKCEFDINEKKDQLVFETGLGGNLRPGTLLEKCVQDEKLRTDPFIQLDATDPIKNIRTTNITSANRQILYGYDTPESYCNHVVEVALENCQSAYDDDVRSCYSADEDLALDYEELQRGHAGTKAARTACHQVYGCMYSKSNERCSVWSVWALVLTLVIMIVVVAVGLGVVGVLVLPKLGGSKA